MDFYRMLTSKYFVIGILGVVGVYGFSLVQLKSQDVYLLNYYIKFYSTYMLLLIFGAVAYSNAVSYTHLRKLCKSTRREKSYDHRCDE